MFFGEKKSKKVHPKSNQQKCMDLGDKGWTLVSTLKLIFMIPEIKIAKLISAGKNNIVRF